MPTLVELRTVVRVASLRSMTKAAQELHYSVSTVSTQVASVSRKLQVTIFERRGGGVVLTAAGRRVLATIEPVVSAMEALLAGDEQGLPVPCPAEDSCGCPGLEVSPWSLDGEGLGSGLVWHPRAAARV